MESRKCLSGPTPAQKELKNTVHVKGFTKEKLKYIGSFPCHVIRMEEGQITTRDVTVTDICQDDLEGNGILQKNRCG